MAGSKIAEGLERTVNDAARGIGRFQEGANKILWGSANTQPVTTVQLVPATGSGATSTLNYTTNVPTAPQTAQQSKLKSFAQSGLFNILNALNSVDLCNVLTYAYDNINFRKRQRPQPPYTGSQAERFFYEFQDKCGEVTKYIDKYTAYPNVFIGSYLGIGPNAIPPATAVDETGAPIQGGTQIQKYNTYFLMQAIRETITPGTGTGSLFSPEDAETIRAVPGLANNLTFLQDSINLINQYADYRQIPDNTLRKVLDRIGKIRATCVTIQNLSYGDIKGIANLVGNYLGVDIRSQIQQLQKYIDVTKIVPTLKQINNALRSFIAICNQVQKIITFGQFIIKLGILLYKVFKFILTFFGTLAIPSLFGTKGSDVTLQGVVNKAKDESDGIMRLLQAVNALLAVVVNFVKYLLGNTLELLRRLETLLAVLQGCSTLKDSDVLLELEETGRDLVAVKDQLETYIIQFEGKTSPDTAEFGPYQIRVETEEVVEETVRNLRRRGIALDKNGRLVTQSDLTFATNEKIIIEEVKQKLVSLGLINPVLANIDSANLAIISDSLNYLDTSDVLEEDLNISTENVALQETGDNLDENRGLGLQAFINNLKGGRRLRKRTRKQLAKQQAELRAQLAKEQQAARASIQSSVNANRAQGKTIYKYAVNVTGPGRIVGRYVVEATSEREAISYAKKLADPQNQYPNYTYKVKQL